MTLEQKNKESGLKEDKIFLKEMPSPLTNYNTEDVEKMGA